MTITAPPLSRIINAWYVIYVRMTKKVDSLLQHTNSESLRINIVRIDVRIVISQSLQNSLRLATSDTTKITNEMF